MTDANKLPPSDAVVLWDFDAEDAVGASPEESIANYENLLETFPASHIALNHEVRLLAGEGCSEVLSRAVDSDFFALRVTDSRRNSRICRTDRGPLDSGCGLQACRCGRMPWYRALPGSRSARSARRYVDLRRYASSSWWPGVTGPHSTSSQRHCSGHSPFTIILRYRPFPFMYIISSRVAFVLLSFADFSCNRRGPAPSARPQSRAPFLPWRALMRRPRCKTGSMYSRYKRF